MDKPCSMKGTPPTWVEAQPLDIRQPWRKTHDGFESEVITRQVVVAEGAGLCCVHLTRGTSNQMTRRSG